MTIKDKIFGGDTSGWAEHCRRPEILQLLNGAHATGNPGRAPFGVGIFRRKATRGKNGSWKGPRPANSQVVNHSEDLGNRSDLGFEG